MLDTVVGMNSSKIVFVWPGHVFFCSSSEEHVSVLLDIRGDVSRDTRGAVLDLLEQSAPPLPVGYRPIFTDILVRPPTMAFCLPTAKCAWSGGLSSACLDSSLWWTQTSVSLWSHLVYPQSIKYFILLFTPMCLHLLPSEKVIELKDFFKRFM